MACDVSPVAMFLMDGLPKVQRPKAANEPSDTSDTSSVIEDE